MKIHHFDHRFCAKHERHEGHGSRGGHGHHEHGGGMDGKARMRRERLFDANDIRLLILHFLSGNTAHGYELIKSIEATAKGEYVPSPGIIYPNLSLLEEMGFIAAVQGDSSKKAWMLTEEGQTELAAQQEHLGHIIAKLESLGVLGDNRRLPEIQRAIHNFKMALNTKLGRSDLQKETLYKIIDTLDQAAKDIERS